MKIIYSLILIVVISLASIYINLWDNDNNYYSTKNINEELNKIDNDDNELNNSWSLIQIKEITKEDTDDKIEKLKKRFSVKWIILKWDLYIERNQPTLAIKEYLEALKKAPDDEKILSKIWDTYITLWEYKKAFSYYYKSMNYNDETKHKYIKSLISVNTENINNTWAIDKIIDQIKEVDISEEKRFYYTNSLKCIEDFHLCKKNFWEYIESNWVNIDEMIKIKDAIENYENFQSNEIYYKNTLITKAIFDNWLYPIVIHLWKKILETNPWYKPILLMVWKSYYEIWDYTWAKEYLAKYYEIEPTDYKVTYLLWIIAFNNEDYISSNMYFNSAIKNWYTPKINLERRLIYNYFMLDNKKWILDVFTYLLKNDDVQADDFALWIYHAIEQWKTLTAISWSKKALELFPEEEIFYWYLWRIYREDYQYKKSLINLMKWLRINPRNPLVTLNMGYLKLSEEKYSDALEYFETTISANKNWEFWILAQKEVKEIKNYLEIINKDK